ncbi:hypothetical protein BDB13_5805 [Rhodococcus sp. OK302]|nr:hypothetical protein BDB13_5805 [Rhodococcus sp. OK302]
MMSRSKRWPVQWSFEECRCLLKLTAQKFTHEAAAFQNSPTSRILFVRTDDSPRPLALKLKRSRRPSTPPPFECWTSKPTTRIFQMKV